VDLVVTVVVLSGLGLLVHLFGTDSRDPARSEEDGLMRRGLARVPVPVPARPCGWGRRRPEV
jgi:hypothetical protein